MADAHRSHFTSLTLVTNGQSASGAILAISLHNDVNRNRTDQSTSICSRGTFGEKYSIAVNRLQTFYCLHSNVSR